MSDIEKYGCKWDVGDPAAIELACIRQNGRWKVGDKSCGMGLAYHVKALAKIALPWFYWHRWNELVLEQLCSDARRITIFGAASSQKTSTASLYAWAIYSALPRGTTVLVSTTTREMLDMRIWGEIKMIWRKARERVPWLPGVLTDSKQTLTTDGKDVEGRDFRDGVVGRPVKRGGTWVGLGDFCFPGETMIDTPYGARRIADIQVGDEVLSAVGTSRVLHKHTRHAPRLVRIHLQDGRTLDCTPDHPFLTHMGWVNSVDLSSTHQLISAHEAMSILRGSVRSRPRQHEVLHGVLKGAAYEDVQELSSTVSTEGCEKHFLLKILRDEVEDESALVCEADFGQQGFARDCETNQRSTFEESREQTAISECGEKSLKGREAAPVEKKLDQEAKQWREGIQEFSARSANANGNDSARPVPGCSLRAGHPFVSSRGRISTLLPAGSRMAGFETRGGDRRRDAHAGNADGAGQAQGASIERARVDFVEILERAGDARYNESERGYLVHNLAVEGHPSYCVEGLLVHNCGIKNDRIIVIADEYHLMPDAIGRSLSNLASNEGCKFIALGNLGDLTTPLGEEAEPEHGWDSIADSNSARVYKTKWFGGKAIQLPGEDSPNLDFPEGQEPYKKLIGRRFLAECEQNYGKGTPLYNMMAGGMIPRGTLELRVLTKQVCMQFNAFDPVTWGSDEVTKLYCADISYTFEHGDKSVGIPLGFGRDTEGKLRISLLDRPKVFDPSDREEGTQEDQLAGLVKLECERLGIPPSHFFFDGTGRSSFTAACMRLWSTSVNPVEFGGKATDRANFMGRKRQDGTDKGELFKCSEVFEKFVSELWFALRYAVEADQIRGLTEDIVREASLRLYRIIKGNRMELEPKKDMKVRLGRSPDSTDALVTGLEGARRLGFPLGKLAGDKPRNRELSKWLREQTKRMEALRQSRQLNAS